MFEDWPPELIDMLLQYVDFMSMLRLTSITLKSKWRPQLMQWISNPDNLLQRLTQLERSHRKQRIGDYQIKHGFHLTNQPLVFTPVRGSATIKRILYETFRSSHRCRLLLVLQNIDQNPGLIDLWRSLSEMWRHYVLPPKDKRDQKDDQGFFYTPSPFHPHESNPNHVSIWVSVKPKNIGGKRPGSWEFYATADQKHAYHSSMFMSGVESSDAYAKQSSYTKSQPSVLVDSDLAVDVQLINIKLSCKLIDARGVCLALDSYNVVS
jgi:hypothetical protein